MIPIYNEDHPLHFIVQCTSSATEDFFRDQSNWRADAETMKNLYAAAAIQCKGEWSRLPEIIVAAAVRTPTGVSHMPPPARHHHIVHKLHDEYRIVSAPKDQGFLTSYGRFVSREEAARIAVDSRQITVPQWGNKLFSEDLW